MYQDMKSVLPDSAKSLEPVDMGIQLDFCHWINANSHTNIFFTGKAHSICDRIKNTKPPIYGITIIHMGQSEATTNTAFP
jgi:hypothetical protein